MRNTGPRSASRASSAPPSGSPQATAMHVAPLAAFGRADVAVAGGKGANLGELIRAGFPVPPGFVVTTAAYDLAVDRAGLAKRIPALLAGEGDAGAAIREELAGAAVPAGVAGALLAAYRALGGGAVAVRSSATTEDLPGAAFAGQHDTYLNVVGEAALLEALRGCWASLWTERAIAYRRAHGLDPAEASIAAVVQRMARAEAAGVLFTANPVTGARDEVVIDASAGLGEAVVAGLVTPDHYVVAKRTHRLRGWAPGRREVVVRPRPAGGTEQVTEQEPAGTPAGRVLTGRALRRLARLGEAIERHFGGPQDVEWAWAGGEALIVQARPVTSLPSPVRAPGRLGRAAAGIAAEMLPVRPYPLDVTTWTGALMEAVAGLLGFAGISFPLMRALVEEDGVVVRVVPPKPRPTPRVALAPARLLRLAARHDPAGWRADPAVAEIQRRARALEQRDLQALDWAGLLATMRESLALPAVAMGVRLRYLPRTALALVRLRVLLGVLRRRDRLGALLSSGDTKTAEVNRELEALADEIRSDPTLAELFAAREPAELQAALAGSRFGDELRGFLDRYGHRETTTPLVATEPTWKAVPGVVLGLLKGFAAAPPPATGRPARQAVLDELLAHPMLRFPPLRSAILKAVDQVGLLVQIREDTRFYATLPLPVIRRTMLELGRRLAAAGALEQPEAVFHLRLAELELAWPPSPAVARELRTLARRREAKRAQLAAKPLIDPRLLATTAPEGDALLRGTPGSPGVAEGPARIILGSAEFGRLRPGDVLVAPYTHPAWTPLFRRAAAVVVDTGGPASHAAIVAREYGIPAVMATADGTRRLADGQPVRVDGDHGLVLLPRPGQRTPGS